MSILFEVLFWLLVLQEQIAELIEWFLLFVICRFDRKDFLYHPFFLLDVARLDWDSDCLAARFFSKR